MSDQTGPEELDAYLLGESALSKAYAALDEPSPSAALDEAVMEKASRALRDSETLANDVRRRHWMVPASLVAIVLLSFTVVMRLILDPFAPEADPATTGKTTQGILLERPNLDNTRQIPLSPARPADSPAERPALRLEPSAERLRATQHQIDIQAVAPKQDIGGKGATDPGRWLEEIEALANDGNLAEAQAELERFRDAYPEHSLDAELQQLSR